MDKPGLKDEKIFPDDKILSQHLGDSKIAFDAYLDYVNQNIGSVKSEWRYYKDGHNWLMKITKKSKTICWISVFDKMFKITFYFSDKARGYIETSQLEKNYKDLYKNGKYYGKIKAISLDITKSEQLENAKILISIKEKLK